MSNPHLRRVCTVATLLALASALSSLPLTAQGVPLRGFAGGLAAGGELDNYLRYLQTLGLIGLESWTIRPFSPAQEDSLAATRGTHPWASTWQFERPASATLVSLPQGVSARFNSSYPFNENDGAIWAGKGVTGVVSAGIAGRTAHFRVLLAPVAFAAQNTAFTLRPNGFSDGRRFADPDFPTGIDRPQRFGEGTYGRVDPGQSEIRLSIGAVTGGVASTNQWWGPAVTYPYVIGNNAAGIPRAFLATTRPVDVRVAQVGAQLSYGLESQSPYSPVTGSSRFTSRAEPGTTRFMSALAVVIQPRFVPGLELGAGQFVHSGWFGRVRRVDFLAPFRGSTSASLRSSDPTDEESNSEATAFFRWVLPHSGAEVYGEYGREDRGSNQRDLASEPDHSRAANVGFRKVFPRDSLHFSAIRAEIFDANSPTLGRHRPEGYIYLHTVLRQGHTQYGKVIGSYAGVGSPGGAILALDRYSPTGRLTWYVERLEQNNVRSLYPASANAPSLADETGTVGVERWRPGHSVDMTFGAAFTFARRPGGGAAGPNLNLVVGVSRH